MIYVWAIGPDIQGISLAALLAGTSDSHSACTELPSSANTTSCSGKLSRLELAPRIRQHHHCEQ